LPAVFRSLENRRKSGSIGALSRKAVEELGKVLKDRK
jgi:hypothetical protein